jgi:hypothetical protein
MSARKLRHDAFEFRHAIQHVIATAPPCEVNGRIEDIIHTALADLDDGVRRAVRREHAAGA